MNRLGSRGTDDLLEKRSERVYRHVNGLDIFGIFSPACCGRPAVKKRSAEKFQIGCKLCGSERRILERDVVPVYEHETAVFVTLPTRLQRSLKNAASERFVQPEIV